MPFVKLNQLPAFETEPGRRLRKPWRMHVRRQAPQRRAFETGGNQNVRFCVTINKTSYQTAEVELTPQEVQGAGEDLDDAAIQKFWDADVVDSDWDDDWEVNELKPGDQCGSRR